MATGHPRRLPGYPTTLALYPVSVRRIRVYGLGFLQIPPPGGHPCLALRFRSSRPAEDLHLLKQHIPGTQPKRRQNAAVQYANPSPAGSRVFRGVRGVRARFWGMVRIRVTYDASGHADIGPAIPCAKPSLIYTSPQGLIPMALTPIRSGEAAGGPTSRNPCFSGDFPLPRRVFMPPSRLV